MKKFIISQIIKEASNCNGFCLFRCKSKSNHHHRDFVEYVASSDCDDNLEQELSKLTEEECRHLDYDIMSAEEFNLQFVAEEEFEGNQIFIYIHCCK